MNSSLTFREHRKYDINTPLLSLEMFVTFLTHFSASIYPGKASLSMLQAGFFFFIQLHKNSHPRDVRHGRVFCSSLQQMSPRMTNTRMHITPTDNVHFTIITCFTGHVIARLRFSLLLASLRARGRKQNRNNTAEPTQVNTNTELNSAYTEGLTDVCLHVKSKQHHTHKFL